MPFELRHLRAFVHLAETKHFGVTAERLGITQPALSQTIKGLEEALGVVLLDRRSRRISLTDAGEIFLAEAIATMVQADRAERIGKRTGRGQAGLVEIGYVGSAPFSPVFGRIISSFREKFVGLSLRMTQLPSMVQMDRIAQSSLDFGFVRTPLAPPPPGVITRNARLAAIGSLFRYAALRHPEHAAAIERVLAIPRKRFDRKLVTFLTEPELDVLLHAPNRSTWTGRRDHTLLTLAAQTGLRASELISLRVSDVHLSTGAHVSCMGKGRKLRITPITSGMVGLLRTWLTERAGQPAEPLFITQSGTSLSRDAVEHRLAKYVQIATCNCRSLGQKAVTMC